MSEWWTYRPSDFLMFSARTWSRLVEGWNRELWPWQLALLAAGALLVLAAWRDPYRWRATALAVLAAAWAWAGWAFHWQRFAPVNTAAAWYAVAFAAQAGLLLVAAFTRASVQPPREALRIAGLFIAAFAVAGYPMLGPLAGGGWMASEVAGAMPDPTALLTAGLLLALPQRYRAALLPIPALALLAGWTTAWLLRAG